MSPSGRVPPRRALAAAVAALPIATCAIALALGATPAGAPPASAPATTAPATAATTRPATLPASSPTTALPTGPLMPTTLPEGASLAPASAAPATPWSATPGAPEKAHPAGHGPSVVVIPVQTIPLNMNHKFHLAFGKCVDCHVKAATSKSAADSLIPDEAQCAECHGVDRTDFLAEGAIPPANCSYCHRGFDDRAAASGAKPVVYRVALPEPHLRFTHARHTEKGVKCEQCHVGVRDTTYADRDDLPRMALCLGCHDGRRAPDACATCHVTEKDGKLKVEWPEGTLTPSDALRGMAHVPGFEFVHDEIASTAASTCMSCHREEECGICHAGTKRPATVHVGDYALKHAVEARRGDPDCSACHRLQTFCIACHTRAGVSMIAPAFAMGAAASGIRFHPPGWNDITAASSPLHHSTEARKNITSCIGCHREKDCARCHAEIDLFCLPGTTGEWCYPGALPGFGGGVRINPHPTGFAKVCDRFMKRNVTACLRCHTPDYITATCGP